MASTDYSKKTNAELAELLKGRGLAHTGKKAELVARLQESDAASTAEATTTEAAAPAAPAEDVIDWDDDADIAIKPTSESSAAALAAGGQGAVANPTVVPNQIVDTEPSTTDDLTVAAEPATTTEEATAAADAPAAATEEAAPEPVVEKKDFTRGLAVTSREEEIAKRKARAAKFGIEYDDAADKRAARFGTGTTEESAGVKGLDEALPERGPRKRGRGEEESAAGGRGGKRRNDGRGGRGGGRGDRRRGDGGRPAAGQQRQGGQTQSKPASSGMSEKDRIAAEARRQRFATAN